ncbi:hypothetical protein BC830DRAFT_749895 [Chytriomyces sp. MP71]|nr:hypothetical protein BC830DRAFT_749895 [Chytriomyces sp. MP71]
MQQWVEGKGMDAVGANMQEVDHHVPWGWAWYHSLVFLKSNATERVFNLVVYEQLQAVGLDPRPLTIDIAMSSDHKLSILTYATLSKQEVYKGELMSSSSLVDGKQSGAPHMGPEAGTGGTVCDRCHRLAGWLCMSCCRGGDQSLPIGANLGQCVSGDGNCSTVCWHCLLSKSPKSFMGHVVCFTALPGSENFDNWLVEHLFG